MMMLCERYVEKGESNSVRRFARHKKLSVYLSVGLVFKDAICGDFDSPLSKHLLLWSAPGFCSERVVKTSHIKLSAVRKQVSITAQADFDLHSLIS
jgi:hypothetical protein